MNSHRDQTDIPPVNSDNLKALLGSLYDMNWRTLAELLAEQWTAQGFDVEDYWD